jgi:PST family polysaccharide transporter
MGGAAGINLLLGMVRTKFVAVLIGTTGIGLLANFSAIQGLVGTLFGLGIQSSAVREVAAAVGKGDDNAIGRAVLTLRRICWLTGMAGMFAMMALSPLISQLTFGSGKYTLDIAALGVIILFANLSGGQTALMQGMRRIGDMARANVYGAIFATFAAISFYTWLGLRGIVPALVAVAAMQLVLSWYFARCLTVPPVQLTWRETLSEAGGMVKLGLLFMWKGLLSSAVTYFTVMLITQEINLQAVGLYSAAFALSGIFVNFVLSAMGADYYPRLTGVANDKVAINRMVNEQTEIGLLLAVPGLLATLVLAPWIIQLFYTKEFLQSAELLQWFILGCLGRVISWPIGFVMIAMKKDRLYLLSETFWNFLHLFFVYACILAIGLKGVGIAFAALYLFVILQSYLIARFLTGFEWSANALKLVIASALMATFVMTLSMNPRLSYTTLICSLIVFIYSLWSFLKLLQLLGEEHKLFKSIKKYPVLRLLLNFHDFKQRT